MKFLIISLLSLVTMLANASESKCVVVTKNNLCIELEWGKKVELGTYLDNTVRFKDLSQSDDSRSVYVSVSEPVQFYGWMIMAKHAHGTRPVTTKEVSPGVYRNSNIFFMKGMRGTWQFKVKIADQDYVLFSLDV